MFFTVIVVIGAFVEVAAAGIIWRAAIARNAARAKLKLFGWGIRLRAANARRCIRQDALASLVAEFEKDF